MSTSRRSLRTSEKVEDLHERIADIRSLLSEIVKLSTTVAGGFLDQLRSQASELWKSNGESDKSVFMTIKLNPLQVASVAVASGALVWWLFMRDEHHDDPKCDE